MSNTLLESLWARIDANIGARITRIGELLTQTRAAAERAEFAAEETIQQVSGDFATRNYVDQKVASAPLTGTGSPEGKVEASVGAGYIDTAATNGAIRWIKTSSAGSTGWLVEYGDTGWRDITELVESETLEIESGGHVRIRRTERFLELSFKSVKAKQSGNIYLCPYGFRAPEGENANAYQVGFFSASTYWLGIFGVSAGTIVGSNREFILRLRASNNWPTSLPGIPV